MWLRRKIAQFRLMHDLATEFLHQWSNSWVPNFCIRYNMLYSTDLAVFIKKYRQNTFQKMVSKCMCCGCVTKCLHNTCSLINMFLPQHQFPHSNLSELAQDGWKSAFQCRQKHPAVPWWQIPGISGCSFLQQHHVTLVSRRCKCYKLASNLLSSHLPYNLWYLKIVFGRGIPQST
jgi:hypothetical protein